MSDEDEYNENVPAAIRDRFGGALGQRRPPSVQNSLSADLDQGGGAEPGAAEDRREQRANNRLAGYADGATRVNAWEATQGAKDSAAFEMSVMALSNPERYRQLRQQATNDIRDAVNKAFQVAFDQFRAAGYDAAEAEKEALKSAQVLKDSHFRAMHAKFGQDSLFMKGTAKNNSGIKVPY